MWLIGPASAFIVSLLPVIIFCEKLAPLPEYLLRFDSATVAIAERDFLDVNTQDDLLRTHATLQQVLSEKADEFDIEFLDSKRKAHRCRIEPKSTLAPFASLSPELLDVLIPEQPKTCVYYKKSDGWVYEYCHRKSVRQLSSSNMGGAEVEYSLGYAHPSQFKMEHVAGLNYIESRFVDGDYCALKGGPRETLVRFVCGSSTSKPLEIVRVVEKTVCTYVLIVHAPNLCQMLPVHLQDATLPITINCISPEQPTSAPLSKRAEEAEGMADSLAQMLKTIGKDFENSPLAMKYKDALRTAADSLEERKLGMPEDSSLNAALTKLLQAAEDAQSTQDEPADPIDDDESSKGRFN